MSKMTLQVVASVTNRATGPLKQVERAVLQTGKAIKQSTDAIFQFNRAAFHASLFLNNYLRSIKTLSQDIEEGARLDRLTTQYERVLGPSGELFAQIRNFTDASIDRMEAMRAGIALKTLGISASTSQVAELVSRAGVAAKQAGMDSGEGIKKFTEFLKTGNLELIQSLNLVRTADPVLKTQLQLLGKFGGVMSSAMTAQEKLAIGMAALRRVTQGNMKGNKDLLDTILELKQGWKFLTSEIGNVIGKALQPILETFIDLSWKIKETLAYLRSTDEGFLFLVKSIIMTTTAITGLVAVLGALKLTVKGLGALGFGLPKITLLLTTLAFVFEAITGKVKESNAALKDSPFGKLAEKLKVFGAAMRAVFEMMTNYDPNTGLSKIDKTVAKLLKQYGLITTEIINGQEVVTGGLVTNIGKYATLIKRFVEDVFHTLRGWGKKIYDIFSKITEVGTSFFGKATKIVPNSWMTDLNGLRGLLVKTAAAFLILRKVPILGKLFKVPSLGRLFGGATGDKKGPLGTANDPIYTASSVKELLGGSSLSKIPTGIFGKLFPTLAKGMAKDAAAARATSVAKNAAIYGLSGVGSAKVGVEIAEITALVKPLANFFKNIGRLGVDLIAWDVIFSALEGFVSGFNVNSIFTFFSGLSDLTASIKIDTIKRGFESITDTLTGFVDAIKELILKIPGGRYILEGLGKVKDVYDKGKAYIQKGYQGLGEVASAALTAGGQSATETAMHNRYMTELASSKDNKQYKSTWEGGSSTTERAATLQGMMDEFRTNKQEANAKIIQQGLIEAMRPTSIGGNELTGNEFSEIITQAFKGALDKSKFTDHAEKTAKNTTPKPPKPDAANRGGC